MLIKYPKTIQEAAQLMRETKLAGQTVIPAGNLTVLKSNAAVVREDVLVISTRDLNKIVLVEPENLLTIVEAGLTPAELDRALRSTGLYWPVTGQASRTLGAIMAEGALGVETMARGSMLDWVLGTALVSPEGHLVKSGGKTLKNVSGYDYTRLTWRSKGRLGLCTSFILKLLPRPEMATVLEVGLKNMAEAANLARTIIENQIWPEALKIVNTGQSTILLVWLTGFKEVAETKIAQVAELVGPGLIIAHNDGFTFWENHAAKWPSDDPTLGRLMGTRQGILDLCALINRGEAPEIQKADLDVGGGRVTLALSDPLAIDQVAARVGGLVPDRFSQPGPIYDLIKGSLDPEDRLFPISANG